MRMYRVPVYEGLTAMTLLRWTMEHTEAKGATRNIECVIAMLHAKPEDEITDGIHVTQGELARKARVSPATVKNAVRWMRESPTWVVIPGTGGRPAAEVTPGDDGRSNAYYPVIPRDQLPEGVRLVAERMIAVGTARREIIAEVHA